MPNSHHPPDTTIQSCLCLVRRCELSRSDRPTSAFSVRVRPAVALSVPAPPDTSTLNALVGPTQFTPPHQTRQDGPVCVVSGVVWCRRQLDDCSERVQTLNFSVGDSLALSGIQFTPRNRTIETQTRQFCRVWRGGVRQPVRLRDSNVTVVTMWRQTATSCYSNIYTYYY